MRQEIFLHNHTIPFDQGGNRPPGGGLVGNYPLTVPSFIKAPPSAGPYGRRLPDQTHTATCRDFDRGYMAS